MNYNLDGKIFKPVNSTENGEVDSQTLFYYQQTGNLVTAKYKGGSIIEGHLIAKVLDNGQLDMRYHHLNTAGEFMLGKCLSTPELLDNGKLKFKEEWQWLSGDKSSGISEIVEIDEVTEQMQ
ncbi:n-acetylglutamate synthase [Xanthovirga aplysinae]|uniref:n-acetylglutamate synthase n=1 Tax=Xanthovirga aplysinae TaxID=2529853 RepID=UPI0012BC5024|nr:n-acetylglutamate synthase [Xanthovirga aplysinae]MTI29793.1 n-acetylglutamate synthase [Xanthovirga aplysinae]